MLSLARVRNVLMLVVEAFLESGRSGFRCQVKIQLRFSGLSFLGYAGLDVQLFVKVFFTCLPYGSVFRRRSRRSLSCRIIRQTNGLLETVCSFIILVLLVVLYVQLLQKSFLYSISLVVINVVLI